MESRVSTTLGRHTWIWNRVVPREMQTQWTNSSSARRNSADKKKACPSTGSVDALLLRITSRQGARESAHRMTSSGSTRQISHARRTSSEEMSSSRPAGGDGPPRKMLSMAYPEECRKSDRRDWTFVKSAETIWTPAAPRRIKRSFAQVRSASERALITSESP